MEGRRIKGKLLLSARKAIKVDTDGVDLPALYPELSQEARWLLSERFLASAWYPNRAIDEVLRAVAAHRGVAAEAYSYRMGRQCVSFATGSVVSTAVAILATPHRIAKYMPSLWGQFYDSGTTRGQFDASTGRVCVEVSDWHGHTRLQCQNPMGALVEVCVRSDRAEYVSHDHVACVSDGAPACRYEVQFER